MDLKQLYYFQAVAIHRNFSRAAKCIYISQPAMSQRISELEQELGVVLFERNRKGVVLTNAGSVLLKRTQEIIRLIEKIPEEVANASNQEQESMTFVLGISDVALRYDWFTQIIALAVDDLRQIFPKLTVSIKELNSGEIAGPLLNDTVDLCVDFSHRRFVDTEEIGFKVLFRDELVLCIGKRNPLNTAGATCDSILSQPVKLILLDANPGMYKQMSDLLAGYDASPSICYAPNEKMALLMTYTNEGVILFPKSKIRTQNYSDVLDTYPIKKEYANLYFQACWAQNRHNTCVPVLLEILESMKINGSYPV